MVSQKQDKLINPRPRMGGWTSCTTAWTLWESTCRLLLKINKINKLTIFKIIVLSWNKKFFSRKRTSTSGDCSTLSHSCCWWASSSSTCSWGSSSRTSTGLYSATFNFSAVTLRLLQLIFSCPTLQTIQQYLSPSKWRLSFFMDWIVSSLMWRC
jgi:hypothetical protein